MKLLITNVKEACHLILTLYCGGKFTNHISFVSTSCSEVYECTCHICGKWRSVLDSWRPCYCTAVMPYLWTSGQTNSKKKKILWTLTITSRCLSFLLTSELTRLSHVCPIIVVQMFTIFLFDLSSLIKSKKCNS